MGDCAFLTRKNRGFLRIKIMTIKFPLVDIRKDYNGDWIQSHVIDEVINVPLSAPYVVRLEEVPDDGSINARPTISGLTETANYPPNSNEFYINYGTGDIVFNVAQAGSSLTVDYWQKGSLVEAADINYIYNTSCIISPTSPLTPYLGQNWFNTNDGIKYIYDIRNKWLSISSFVVVFGRTGRTSNQYLNYFVSRNVSSISGLRLSKDATIISLSGQFNGIGTGTFHIYKNKIQTSIASLTVTSSDGNEDNLIDVDLNKSDFLQGYFSSSNNIRGPIIMVEIAWRSS